MRREAAASDGEHRVTGPHVRHTRADRQDTARAFSSERAGITRVHAERVEDVLEIQSRRLDGDFDFPRARSPPSDRLEAESVDRASDFGNEAEGGTLRSARPGGSTAARSRKTSDAT